MTQLRLERNFGEAIRLLQARQAQFTLLLRSSRPLSGLTGFNQRLAGDTAGAKVTAEQARNTLEQLCKNQPDNPACGMLSLAYAALGEGLSPKGSGTCNHACAER